MPEWFSGGIYHVFLSFMTWFMTSPDHLIPVLILVSVAKQFPGAYPSNHMIDFANFITCKLIWPRSRLLSPLLDIDIVYLYSCVITIYNYILVI